MGLSKFEIWCQIFLSKESEKEIHSFFRDEYSISPEFLISNMHVTVYHARRKLVGLQEQIRNCNHIIDTYDTRFMVLAPGGENPRPNLIPAYKKVGIRVKKQTEFREIINNYRLEMIKFETPEILGKRKPSTKSRNAFGARNFQPHISILKSGSGISKNLTEVGENFRDSIPELKFNRFRVKINII